MDNMQYNNQIYPNNMNQNNQKDRGNLLAGISLAAMIVGFIIPIIITLVGILFTEVAGSDYSDVEGVFAIISMLASGISYILRIVSIVLLIIARVNYPENKFSKILMWVYIVLFIIYLITIIITMLACGFAFATCINELQGCG